MKKSKNTILIVDDVPENIQILLNSLKDDFAVLAAVNGEQALEIAKKEPLPDLIILDILMPDISGYEVCKKLKNSELTKNIPVIFISVLNDITAILNGFEAGGIDYISKPFDVREVSTRVKTHIELASKRKILEEELVKERIERKKQEKRMVHQEKMAAMGEMLALITHQWRQPLSAINAITNNIKVEYVLKKESLCNDTLMDKTDDIGELIQHLSETITDFSNFFKVDRSKQQVYLHKIVEKSVNLLYETIKQESVVLDYSECHFENKVPIFANELSHVLLNIIKNSIDAAVENKIINPKITIKSDENESEQIILIQDNSGGISEDLLEHIFEPDFTTKSDDKGTGLGLYMSRIIVDEHCKGKITAKNNDNGTLFTLQIPKI